MEPNSQQKSSINKEKKAKSKIYKKKALDHYQKPQRIVEKPQNIISNDATTLKPNSRRRNNHVVEDNHHIIQEICPLATSQAIVIDSHEKDLYNITDSNVDFFGDSFNNAHAVSSVKNSIYSAPESIRSTMGSFSSNATNKDLNVVNVKTIANGTHSSVKDYAEIFSLGKSKISNSGILIIRKPPSGNI